MTARTTLAPYAPWPTAADWAEFVAIANERREDRLAKVAEAKKQAKKTRNPPRRYQKAKA